MYSVVILYTTNKTYRINEMIDRVTETVRPWPEFAEKACVSEKRVAEIPANQRINL